VGLDGGEDTPAVRAGDLLGLLVTVFVIRMLLWGSGVFLLLGEGGSGEAEGEGRR